jgi:hypothetical protein
LNFLAILVLGPIYLAIKPFDYVLLNLLFVNIEVLGQY